jgi:class 3 adenylate cyclase
MHFDTENSVASPHLSSAGTAHAWLESAAGDRFPVHSGCAIGRSDTNQVVLKSEKVSRRHAIVHAHGAKGFWLTDLGSSNGTYLNGRRVTQATKLFDQDVLAIGQFQLTFRHPAGRARPKPKFTLTDVTVREVKTVNCWLLIVDLESSTTLARSLAPEQIPVVMGRWLDACKEIVEQNGGSVNKYLGDGFLAYWHDLPENTAAVARALTLLKEAQTRLQPPFRLVVHHGQVSVGGAASIGEESLMGAEVNFAFRMEKLAGVLKTPRLASATAQTLLASHFRLAEVGRHGRSGFEGDFVFYEF